MYQKTDVENIGKVTYSVGICSILIIILVECVVVGVICFVLDAILYQRNIPVEHECRNGEFVWKDHFDVIISTPITRALRVDDIVG